MPNSTKYAEWPKEALTSEIKVRRSNGRKISVDLRADEDTLRTALDNDDVENGEFNSGNNDDDKDKPSVAPDAPPVLPVTPLDATKPSATPGKLLSQVPLAATAPSVSNQPKEKEWNGAPLYRHKKDGYSYQVIRRESDPHERPVKARVPAQETGHPGLFWEGTVAEFEQCFEKL